MTARVLVIDDAPEIRYLIRWSLVQLGGFELLEAPDGWAGLALARATRPDVILLDLGLPVRDGFDVLRELKATAETSAIPVVMVTGRARAMPGLDRAGAQAVVTKPFDPRRLPQVVRSVLARGSGANNFDPGRFYY